MDLPTTGTYPAVIPIAFIRQDNVNILKVSYFFKKSHAVAYAQAVVVQMNLIKRKKN